MDRIAPLCSRLLATEPIWFAADSPCAQRVPPSVQDWLAESSSLTARLNAIAGPVQVEVLHQDWDRPFAGEAMRLKLLPGERVWTREVVLTGQGERLLLARTVVPAVTMAGVGEEFPRLGNRPLGELLFCRPDVRRVVTEWTCLDPTCWLAWPKPLPRWGRRTLYRIAESPLLVSEFFLPAVFALGSCNGFR